MILREMGKRYGFGAKEVGALTPRQVSMYLDVDGQGTAGTPVRSYEDICRYVDGVRRGGSGV